MKNSKVLFVVGLLICALMGGLKITLDVIDPLTNYETGFINMLFTIFVIIPNGIVGIACIIFSFILIIKNKKHLFRAKNV